MKHLGAGREEGRGWEGSPTGVPSRGYPACDGMTIRLPEMRVRVSSYWLAQSTGHYVTHQRRFSPSSCAVLLLLRLLLLLLQLPGIHGRLQSLCVHSPHADFGGVVGSCNESYMNICIGPFRSVQQETRTIIITCLLQRQANP